jgi:PPOX class probable F420-dependent enzyme
VSVHLNSDERGGRVVTFEGRARVVQAAPDPQAAAAYLEKYRQGIVDIGMTPEQMGAEYSTALLITPSRVRLY